MDAPARLHSGKLPSKIHAGCARQAFAVQIRLSQANAAASVSWILLVFLTFNVANARQSLPEAPKPKNTATQTKGVSENAWPRSILSGPNTFTVYQPQVDKWHENLIDLYCAVEFKAGTENTAKYGVVWFQARTEVDKINRLVTLDQAKVTKVKFPVARDKEAELTALLEKKLPGATKTISLDRLEAALEAESEAVITLGGDRLGITDAVGTLTTGGALGAAPRSPTCTEYGATRRIRVRAQLGRILTLGTMVPRAAVLITTPKRAGV